MAVVSHFDLDQYRFRGEPERRPATAVASFDLDGYRFQGEPERASCTITHDGTIIITNLAWRLLGRPGMAAFFHDPEHQAMAIVAATPGRPAP